MSLFGRHVKGLEVLEKIAREPGDHWWKDLLALWRPSGQACALEPGDFGLRLAIRNGYLNFYRMGQSVARVEVSRKGASARTHIKYVAPNLAGASQEYATLQGDWLVRPKGAGAIRYEGLSSLKSWIAAVDGSAVAPGYSGPEKRFVDKLVGENGGVIDLEMALPAWTDKRSAPRMDLVALEMSDQRPKIVFWEAKLLHDSRIRCRGPALTDKKPEVLEQLSRYRNFLEDRTRLLAVEEAYQGAAEILVRLRLIADALGPTRPLSRVIHDAATNGVTIDRQARLVVRMEDSNHVDTWPHDRLKLSTAGIPLLEVEPEGSHQLQMPK